MATTTIEREMETEDTSKVPELGLITSLAGGEDKPHLGERLPSGESPLTDLSSDLSVGATSSKQHELDDDVSHSSPSLLDEAVSETSVVSKDIIDVSLRVDLEQLRDEDEEERNLAVEDTRMSAAVCSPSPDLSVYHIKWIKWKDNKTAIITQNENGPCPLIAIMNVLILKGKVHLPPMIEMITAGQLMDYLGDCILEYTPKNISEGAQLNYEQNMHDAMAVLPKLQTGLDVNVKFTGVSDFEYTPECIIFDLLNIPLFHGWLVDPQLTDVVSAVANLSYNQLVERIITDKTSPKPDVVTGALVAENFLERNASQLTYHGLCELNAAIREDEVCVLFRNNHFSTIYKYKHELFQLVTDQGFLTESSVIWETLSNIDGDGQFVDSTFNNVPPKSGACSANPTAPISSVQQIDQDEELARRLQLEEQTAEQASVQRGGGGGAGGAQAAGAAAAAGSTSERPPAEGKKKSDCVIL